MSIKNVTVAGGGILGGQIAFQSQFMGFNVTVYDVNDSALKHSEQLMTSYPDIYKNFYEDGQKADEVIENIRFSSNLADAVAFHRVWRSAYSGGAWDGRRMSEQITPPLRV